MPSQHDRRIAQWGQLTYTSADAMAGAGGWESGGWGIKETGAGLSEAVLAQLRTGVTTRLVEVVETSQFASGEQLQARPRRLTFRTIDRLPMLWHAASAGPDATGRPGNVFTHAAAQAAPDPGLRPIGYWRSPDWLAPFGMAEVTAARLGQLRPGAAVTRETVLAFVREPDRLFCLEWLLAAVSHALRSRMSLVLATDTPDEAALWLGAISFLTGPGLAQRVSWTTFERADGVEESAARGLTVICVPRADVQTLLDAQPPGTLVVDPAWDLGEPVGDRWLSRSGQAFPTEPIWQNAMLDLFALNDAAALRVLADIDTLTAMLAPAVQAGLPFHWPLSMVLLTDDEAAVGRRDDVIATCLEIAPPSALETPQAKRLIDELVAGSNVALSNVMLLGRLASAPGASAAVLEANAVATAVSYLGGGWRSEAAPPALSTNAARRVPKVAAGAIAVAIKAAERGASGTRQEVLAAATLVSFVLVHELDPPPLSDDVPSTLATVVETLRARLADQAPRFGTSEISRLHPSLLVRAPVGQAPPHVMSRSTPWSTPWREDARDVAEPISVPQRVRDLAEARSGMVALLSSAKIGSSRAKAIAECLMLAHGIGQVPLRRPEPGLEQDMSLAGTLASAARTPRPLKTQLLAWLAVYAAMTECGDLQPTPGREPTPAFLAAVGSDPEPFTAELTAYLLEASVDQAVRFVQVAIERELSALNGSLLGVPVGDTSTLGWSAVVRAFQTMAEGRADEIVAIARPSLERLGPRARELIRTMGSQEQVMRAGRGEGQE